MISNQLFPAQHTEAFHTNVDNYTHSDGGKRWTPDRHVLNIHIVVAIETLVK